jgi:hypothetical protein
VVEDLGEVGDYGQAEGVDADPAVSCNRVG